MTSKILATFRCDPEKWQRFKARAELNNTNASALLLQFIDWYLAGNTLTHPKEKRLDSRTPRGLDNMNIELEQRLVSLLDKHLDKNLNSRLSEQLKSIWERLESVEATVANKQASTSTQEKAAKPRPTALEPHPDLEKIRTRILKCLKVGKQSQMYKRVLAEFDRINASP